MIIESNPEEGDNVATFGTLQQCFRMEVGSVFHQ